MKTLFQSTFDLQNFFLVKGWKFCFIGGIALQRWGEPRLTLDADVSLLCGDGEEEKICAEILSAYKARINNALPFAIEHRVLLAADGNGVKFDISLASFDFEKEIIERASYYKFSETISLLTCSAEDLAVMKAFACREKDLADLRAIADRQKNSLDIKFIRKQLSLLAPAKPDEAIEEKAGKILGW